MTVVKMKHELLLIIFIRQKTPTNSPKESRICLDKKNIIF